MTDFLLNLFRAGVIQLGALLGGFFALGYLLYKLQSATHSLYHRAVGWKGILWTAWLGTPVHELGHAFFAKLFRHRITEISLFSPNKETGGLGHVSHTYDLRSVYQRLGNFFIGAAPIISGSVVLSLASALFLDGALLSPVRDLVAHPSDAARILLEFAQALWQAAGSGAGFWLFAYISFCISAHIAPSRQDLKSMWRGFGWIAGLLLLANSILLLGDVDITQTILNISAHIFSAAWLLLYALFISIIHYLLAFSVLYPLTKIRRRVQT